MTRSTAGGITNIPGGLKPAAGGTINVLIDTPPGELQWLNENWVHRVTGFNPQFFSKCAEGQQPPVFWVGCSDSRVPEGVITATPPGKIFTLRNIGNQFPTDDLSTQSALEFAVNTLGVIHIMVVGHTKCGAVATAYDNARSGDPPPTETSLERWLVPLTQRIIDMDIPSDTARDEGILLATKENIQMQFDNICETLLEILVPLLGHPCDGPPDINLYGWLYHLETGRIEDLNLLNPFKELPKEPLYRTRESAEAQVV